MTDEVQTALNRLWVQPKAREYMLEKAGAETQSTDPWGTGTDALDSFMSQTASPDLDEDDDPTEVALHSHALNAHLGLIKSSLLQGDLASAHMHADSAMSHQVICHNSACARASETNLHPRSEEED